MRIDKKDFYHGIALTQIVEHPGFKALNKASDKQGHFQVNHDIRLLVKYRSSRDGDDRFMFAFSNTDLGTLEEDLRTKRQRTFVALVCGDESVCLLDESQLRALMKLEHHHDPTAYWGQRIDVDVPPRGSGKSMRVEGSLGRLGRTVPHDRFPRRLFE